MDQLSGMSWPKGLSQVPFHVYQDPELLHQEQRLLFEGPVWNYLCLETEIPNPGDWRTTFSTEMNAMILQSLGWMYPQFGWRP